MVRTLKGLWKYREAKRASNRTAEAVQNAQARLLTLIYRLEGNAQAASPIGQVPTPAFDRPKLLALRNDLIGLANHYRAGRRATLSSF